MVIYFVQKHLGRRIIYQVYFTIPNKLLTLSISSILHSFEKGDEFSIKNKFSYLIKTNSFCTLWIEDKSKYIIQPDNAICNPLIKIYSESFAIKILNYRFYIIQKKHFSENNYPFIYTVKEIEIYLIFTIYFSLISIIFLVSKHLLKIRLKSYQHFVNQVKSAEMSGITTSIRMLAHDIRAPFSMLNIIISSIEKSKNLADMNSKLTKSKIELNIYLDKVTLMLNDFMHFGNKEKENLESFNPEDYIYSSFVNSSKINDKCKINFSYSLLHTHNIYFTKIQFERILSNLIFQRNRGNEWSWKYLV